MKPFFVLEEEGLLDAPTLLVGLRRGWLALEDVEAWALRRLIECDRVDDRLVELSSAKSLFLADVEELLEALGEAAVATGSTVFRRWALAVLVSLSSEHLPEDDLRDRLDEWYGELGYPEELRWCSRYNIRPEELIRAKRYNIPLSTAQHDLDEAVGVLRDELNLGDRG